MAVEDEQRTEPIDILLVEPNPGDTRLFTESFEAANLANEVYCVSDGDDAVDFLYRRGDYAGVPRPDLLLLEPQLPGTSGGDVVAALEGDPALAGTPVVALTSSAVEEEIVRSLDIDADHYVRKPVEPAAFAEFAGAVEEFWLAAVQRAPAGD